MHEFFFKTYTLRALPHLIPLLVATVFHPSYTGQGLKVRQGGAELKTSTYPRKEAQHWALGALEILDACLAFWRWFGLDWLVGALVWALGCFGCLRFLLSQPCSSSWGFWCHFVRRWSLQRSETAVEQKFSKGNWGRNVMLWEETWIDFYKPSKD